MSFQASVRFDLGFGVPGEIKYDSPRRAQAGLINSASAAYNIVGATAFTQPNSGGTVAAGGTDVFYGILANPKLYASFGTVANGPLGPTLTLANNVEGEFLQQGYVVVSVPAACNIGDLVQFDQTTGALSTITPKATFTGVIAVTTGILTVSGIAAGGNITTNSPLSGTGVPFGTVITAPISGTGGNGTYQTNIITAVSSTATMNVPNSAVAGKTLVPNGVIDKFPQSGAGLAVMRL